MTWQNFGSTLIATILLTAICYAVLAFVLLELDPRDWTWTAQGSLIITFVGWMAWFIARDLER